MTPLPLMVYRAATTALEPLAPRLLDGRARRGKEDPARVDERLGRPSASRPEGPLVWLHGVSVGESLSLLPVVQGLRRRRPDLSILVTTGTTTAAAMMVQRLPVGVIHQYAPVDGPAAVAAFLADWRPDVGVLVESELWPNLLMQAKAAGVRLVLASARITQKTADGWARFPASSRRLLGCFDRLMPQDQASAQRLEAMGGRVDGYVNLKLSGEAPPHDPAAFTTLSAAVGDRPVVVVASTHEGEEAAIVRALDALDRRICLIVAPRHPDRRAEIVQQLRADGRHVALRSEGGLPGGEVDVYLADTLGEMGLLLRVADVVVLGGAFSASLGLPPVGGHNPLEPARLGKPALTGPDMSNWASVTAALTEAGGLRIVPSPADLADALRPLLDDPALARDLGEQGRRAAAQAGSGLERLLDAVDDLAPRPARGRR